jgi:serine/threonine protein kinase
MNRASMATIRSIGEGGFGIVEEVWPSNARESVALKRLTDAVRQGPERERNLRRFKREVRLLQNELDHPNIINVIHAVLEGDDPWFLMPLAPHSLDAEVCSGGLPEDRVRELFSPIIDAIEYAHDKGVIHRDLKPHNILVLNGRPVVTDFGLGRQLDSKSTVLTTVGPLGGTLGYVAPEQWAESGMIDHRADIFALGSLLYFLVTGLDPAAFNSRAIPRTYQRLIIKCREVDPNRRYQSAIELREAFEELWHTDTDQDPSPAAQRALLLLQTASINDRDLLALVELYVRNPTDYELFNRTIENWSHDLISILVRETPEDLTRIIGSMPDHLPHHFPFSYLDELAHLLRRVYDATDDLDVCQAALTSILHIGARFDENDMGRTFAAITRKVTDRADQLLIRDVLLNNQVEAQWVASYMRQSQPSGLIAETLEAIEGASGADAQ